MMENTATNGGTSESGYWHESARPLASLVFVAPLLAAYEAGVLWLGPNAIRNSVDVWLRRLLDLLGFGQYFLLPVVTCALLLGWHHLAQQPWRLRWSVLYLMLVESFFCGFVLVLLAGWESRLLAGGSPPEPANAGTAWACALDASAARAVADPARAAQAGAARAVAASAGAERTDAAGTGADDARLMAIVVAYLGAGIYEEVLFRLLLLPVAAAVCRGAGLSWRAGWIGGALATSLLFAAAHYHLDFTLGGWHVAAGWGEPFAWSTFLFRTMAGLVFSGLFLTRGFGVTAGAHAAYDLWTLLV